MSTFAEVPTENDMVVYVCAGWIMEMEYGKEKERTSCKKLTPQKSSMNSDVQLRNMARRHLDSSELRFALEINVAADSLLELLVLAKAA